MDHVGSCTKTERFYLHGHTHFIFFFSNTGTLLNSIYYLGFPKATEIVNQFRYAPLFYRQYIADCS